MIKKLLSVTYRQDKRFRHGPGAPRELASRALDPDELFNEREERIRELKRQIDAGTYIIDPYKIAVRMLVHLDDRRDGCEILI